MDHDKVVNALQMTSRALENAQAVIKELEPLAQLGQLIVDDEDLYSFRDAADHLYEKTGLGRNQFIKWMRRLGILSSTNSERNVPKVQYIKRGYFRLKKGPVPNSDKLYTQTYMTGKGLSWIIRVWEEYGHE